MRAAVYYDQQDIRVEDVAEPEVGPDDVLIDIAACGICGSDLHEYTDGPTAIPTDPHPVTGEMAPTIIGHEFGGPVAAVGEHVNTVSPGDVVAANPLQYCGDCQYCNGGAYNRCTSPWGIGFSGAGGGFAEHIAVPHDRVVSMPETVPAAHAALIEPFSVGLHAVRRGEVTAGDAVAVFGAGPIGLTVIQSAHAMGARDIYAIEPQDARRALAKEVGATVTVDPTQNAVGNTIPPVDVAFEAAGVDASFRDACQVVKRGGCVTVVSLFHEQIEWSPNVLTADEITIRGSRAYDNGPGGGREFHLIPTLFADGTFDPAALISSRIDLADIVTDGFEALLEATRDDVKILVEP